MIAGRELGAVSTILKCNSQGHTFGLFVDTNAHLVQFFVRRSNAALAERATKERESLAELPMQQRLHTLLRWRLEAQQPYVGAELCFQSRLGPCL